MKNRKLIEYLQQNFQQERESCPQNAKREETISACIQIMREQRAQKEETSMRFLSCLSSIFRFEGIHLMTLQAVTLVFVCFIMYVTAGTPEDIPVFIPLFVLAVMPTIFKAKYYKMSEIEAATRFSCTQIMLAKLILAGAANLVAITILLYLEVSLQNSWQELGQMILYCLVPYLVCMVVLLHFIRLRKRDNIQICGIVMLSFCAFWGGTARAMSWLYVASATGIWIIAFLLFTAFFIKEIYVLLNGRGGRMYGTID